MVTSGWKEAELVLRVVWKFASMENGEPCVMTRGMMTIPVWSVDNLVSQEMVCESLYRGGFGRVIEVSGNPL